MRQFKNGSIARNKTKKDPTGKQVILDSQINKQLARNAMNLYGDVIRTNKKESAR